MNTTTTRRVTGRDLLGLVLDADSVRSWDQPPVRQTDSDYARQLGTARERSGVDDAILTGEGRAGGRRIAFAVSEFDFLAGSVGLATAARLVAGIERATAEGLPLLAAPASGGTRMQEGTPAFTAMIGISAAIAAHKRAGLPYITYLRHPTTGGVLASWGHLAHVTAAEPGALVGLLGPKVYHALGAAAPAAGVQSAENFHRRGLIDAVLTPARLRSAVIRLLRLLAHPAARPVPPPQTVGFRPAIEDAWESVTRSRAPDRPGLRGLLIHAAQDVSWLRGDASSPAEQGVVLALARFGSAPCVVVGHDRRPSDGSRLGPEGLRLVRRGADLARELRLPLVTVIDTGGPELSAEVEEGGIAREVALCLQDLTHHRGPVVSLLLGEGAGGAAIALLPADRTVAAQHAWLSPLPPEGASAIVHGTTDRAAVMARQQHIDAGSLLDAGVVDHVVDERPDAGSEPREFCARTAAAVEYELGELAGQDVEHLLAGRLAKYRALASAGLPSPVS
ncbi:carboxyl transferase domain-containing protein [Georgenia halophila]|uniref:Carboxyl transferase domain-containing protein n=1 Tax=Georgenia halophila TaxID=620889 RepID=A0ABP8LLR5_9MICO